jgi:mono/diheme cytochrome c family protein
MQRGRALLAVALATMLSLEAISAFSTPITGPSHGSAEAGKKIFKEKCVICHKPDGSGGFKLTGNPTPDWRDTTRMDDPKHNDDYLRDCITNGKPKSGMPTWSKQGVKPAQIEDLIAFIHTFRGTKKAKK